MRTLESQDSGKTIKMELDGTFEVRLQENPTTGYRWKVQSTPGLEEIGDHFTAGAATGEGGIRAFEFRASSAGSHELRISSGRNWETKDPSNGFFRATIAVK